MEFVLASLLVAAFLNGSDAATIADGLRAAAHDVDPDVAKTFLRAGQDWDDALREQAARRVAVPDGGLMRPFALPGDALFVCVSDREDLRESLARETAFWHAGNRRIAELVARRVAVAGRFLVQGRYCECVASTAKNALSFQMHVAVFTNETLSARTRFAAAERLVSVVADEKANVLEAMRLVEQDPSLGRNPPAGEPVEQKQFEAKVRQLNTLRAAIIDRAPAGGPSAVSFANGVPDDAEVLFNGSSLDRWRSLDGGPARWRIQPDGTLLVNKEGNLPDKVVASIYTRGIYTNFQLHAEYRQPLGMDPGDKWRGNSGVKIFDSYEVQIIDSYRNPAWPQQMCGAIYSSCGPQVNASRAPGEWQTLDIVFHAPQVEDAHVTAQATFTVLHNGVLVQDHVSLPPYPNRDGRDFRTCGDIELQSHNDASPCLSFRNIWIRRLE